MLLIASPTLFVAPDSLSKKQMDSQKTHRICDRSSVFTTLRVEQISPPKHQPRNYFDEGAMSKLIASVKQHGIITPILVRPIGSNQYELVAGERRYKAAKTVGLTEVPVTIRKMSDTEAMHYALMENLQREDLNPIEETEGILQLLELSLQTDRESVISLLNRMAKVKRGLADNVIRQEDREAILSVFQSFGKLSPESFRTNRLPLLNLPSEILDAIRQGQIEYTKGKAIAKVKDAEIRLNLLKEAIADSLSLSEIRERIKVQQLLAERDELRVRVEAIPKKIKKLKVWNDPNKRSQLESLLQQIESLLSND